MLKVKNLKVDMEMCDYFWFLFQVKQGDIVAIVSSNGLVNLLY